MRERIVVIVLGIVFSIAAFADTPRAEAERRGRVLKLDCGFSGDKGKVTKGGHACRLRGEFNFYTPNATETPARDMTALTHESRSPIRIQCADGFDLDADLIVVTGIPGIDDVVVAAAEGDRFAFLELEDLLRVDLDKPAKGGLVIKAELTTFDGPNRERAHLHGSCELASEPIRNP